MDTSVTADDIENFIESVKAQTQNPDVRERLKIYEKQQLNNEEILVSNNQICGNENLLSLREHITNLNAKLLKKDVTDKFYNDQVMKAAMCTMESVLYAPPDEFGTDYHNNLINKYIKNLRQIGTESVNGYAMLGDFDGMTDFFVDKVSRDPENDNLVHEVVVGLYGTNKLRQYIPNFSYVYLGLKCSPPLIDPATKKVIFSCLDNKKLVNYVLYENVAPATSMSVYVRTCTSKQFLNAFMQAMYALRLAHKMIDYTHYDLHAENLLIRNPKLSKGKNFQIPYDTENGQEYITTDVISTFIDYGYSHIKTEDIIDKNRGIILKGQDFGVHGRIHAAIFPNRSWIIYDAYRLLMDCLIDAYNANNTPVINDIKNIYKFFNQMDDPITFIEKRVSGILPMIDKTQNLQLDDLLKHIRSVCDCSFITQQPSKAPILNCENLCPTEEAILADVGLDVNADIKIANVKDIIEFNDLIQTLADQNKSDELERAIKDYDYDGNIEPFLNDVGSMYDELTDKISVFYEKEYPDISQIPDNLVFSFEGMSDIRQTYVKMGEIFNLIDKLQFNIDIGLCVAELYDADADVDYLASFDVDSLINIFDPEAAEILSSYGSYLNSIPNNVSDDLVNKDKRLGWYWGERVALENMYFDLMEKK
jgi:hypothetical protein